MVPPELDGDSRKREVLILRVVSIFGTRPEAIKMAPVVRELAKRPGKLDSLVCVTGQHREMLDQALNLFGIRPDFDLDLMEENQDLPSLTARTITAISGVLKRVQPGLVLVQGDTTTAMAAALAAFYNRIPVGHVEAGLRTQNRYRPFPEEIDRRLIGVLATYHFTPTETAAEALRSEGTPMRNVFVTGNTVIDALLWTLSRTPSANTTCLLDRCGLRLPAESDHGGAADESGDSNLSRSDSGKLILVTAHRRENFGRPLENICTALRAVVQRNPGVRIIYPVHLNPNVRGPVFRMLANEERILLIEPVDYETFAFLMKRAYLILTDSGGIQEEAPSLGKPVLVLRMETERPEAVKAGTAKVIGVEADSILGETERFLHDRSEYERMAKAVNPYGDGHAAERIVRTLLPLEGRQESDSSA